MTSGEYLNHRERFGKVDDTPTHWWYFRCFLRRQLRRDRKRLWKTTCYKIAKRIGEHESSSNASC